MPRHNRVTQQTTFVVRYDEHWIATLTFGDGLNFDPDQFWRWRDKAEACGFEWLNAGFYKGPLKGCPIAMFSRQFDTVVEATEFMLSWSDADLTAGVEHVPARATPRQTMMDLMKRVREDRP